MKLWLVLISLNFYFINGYIVDPGPVVKATEGKIWFLQINVFSLKFLIQQFSSQKIWKGEIWPKPFEQKTYAEFFEIRRNSFNFEVNFMHISHSFSVRLD